MFTVRRDTWLTFVVCLVFGIFVLIDTLGYPSVKGQGFGHGPAFYPRVLAGVLVGLGLLVLIQDILGKKRLHDVKTDQTDVQIDITYRSIIIFMVLCIFSIIVMKYVGFLLSGFILVFVFSILIRASFRIIDISLVFLYSAAMMALVYIVFDVFIGVDLPNSSIF